MEIVYRKRAREDLLALQRYIAEHNPPVAAAVAERVAIAIDHLREAPYIGRRGRVTGSRELLVSGTPYIVAYYVTNDTIEIIAVLHGARQWPETF